MLLGFCFERRLVGKSLLSSHLVWYFSEAVGASPALDLTGTHPKSLVAVLFITLFSFKTYHSNGARAQSKPVPTMSPVTQLHTGSSHCHHLCILPGTGCTPPFFLSPSLLPFPSSLPLFLSFSFLKDPSLFLPLSLLP